MQTFKFESFEIQIFVDDVFTPGSADNKNQYAHEYKSDSEPSTKIGIKVVDTKGLIKSSAIILNGGGASVVHPTSSVIDDDRLVVCVSDALFCLALPTLNLLWRTQADQATCFEVFLIPDGYIVHGEMEITRVDREGRIIWSQSGSDIFTTPDGHDEFRIESGIIRAQDWNDRIYQFDLNGKPIR